ncbi:MAG: hydroxyacid dehydrogenase [Chloroflexi bacterium]|nr:hydroxyacid dehydrogenase [Chloroflexota bacterium]|tara:strand:+ start:5460 stop:6452 length:993 start_codon:yes stop_codon:yes gene_type:complete
MKLSNFAFFPPLDEVKKDFINRIQRDYPGIKIFAFKNESEVLSKIHLVQAGYGWVSPDALKHANNLKWLANPDTGSFVNESGRDGWFYKELVEHPVVVTNPRGIYSDHIGNHIMTYLLALSKRFPDFFEAQRRKEWNQNANRHEVIHLNQATVMIVGAGGIGQEVGRLCKAFNMEVIGVDPKFDRLENFDEVIKPEQLYDFLGNIDVLVSTVMHTPETQNLFNLKLFKKMKPTSIFINIGRGKTTSLDDLVNALENNIISGAGLDVFEEEPLPKNHKLWNLPGVIITPHVALLDADGIINNRRYEIIQKNIILFNEGKELHNIVDKEKWY